MYEHHHKKAVLEDGRLYDTESAEKVFTDESSLEYITLGRAKRRAYFLTPHGNWFSAEEEVETESGITDVGEYRIQVTKTIYTYTDLRIERTDTVKILLGKNDYELYKKIFWRGRRSMNKEKEIYELLPSEPVDVAAMLIKATIVTDAPVFALSPMLEGKMVAIPKYDPVQLQEIAEHLLVYCNAQERGCADVCCENCEP